MKRKILITGKKGQLGKEIYAMASQEVFNKNFEFVFVGREEVDLLNEDNLRQTINAIQPFLIIHTAAKVGGIQFNLDNSYKMLYENLILDLNLIRAALDSKTSVFIYFSSSCMYPISATQPFEIDSIFKGELEPTNEFYAIAKSSITKLLQEMDLQGVSNFKTLVLSNLYGKNDNFSLRNGHAVAAAFTKILEAKRNNSKIVEIWGSGKPRREFTLAKDVARFVLSSLPNIDTFPSVLNLGCGYDYSINEIYEIVSKTLNHPVEFKHNLLKPDGVFSKLMDSSIAMKNHKWSPEADLSKGLLAELIPNLSLIEQ